MSVNLLKLLIETSEKAANIARLCRENKHLFSLLVEEKSEQEANPRFVQDFKTLADVLIQETIRVDVGKNIPEMINNVNGEETTKFTNSLGESIYVEIFSDSMQTMERLKLVLNGDERAALLLSQEVHRDFELQSTYAIPDLPNDLDYSNLGIWIDPIDGTAEYIKGEAKCTQFPEISNSGLECVTILIGVYEINTGTPIMGVINQPFYKKIPEGFSSNIYWGISIGELKDNNIGLNNRVSDSEKSKRRVILSSSEHEEYIKSFHELNWDIVYAAGAGYKLLKVISGEVDAYFLSKNTSFKWDTCGPQAILNSINSKLLNFKESMKSQFIEINYANNIRCNNGGLLCCRDNKLLNILLDKLL